MELNPQVIDAYRQILSNPTKYGFEFKPFNECFVNTDSVTAKHILFEQYINYLQKAVPKVIFYILMDEVYGFGNGKDEEGNLGYSLKLLVDA